MRTKRAERRLADCIMREGIREWEAKIAEQEKRQEAEKQYLLQCDKCWEEYKRWRNNYHDDYLEPLDDSHEDYLLKERQRMMDEKEKVEKEIQSMIAEVYGADNL